MSARTKWQGLELSGEIEYGTLDEGPITEFSVQRVNVRRIRRAEPRSAADDTDYIAVRKAVPVNDPLPATMKWIARLPASVRPYALLRQFPRVANALALASRDDDALSECLYGLLVDRRGRRRGFPGQVTSELLALRQYFESRPVGRV